MCVLDQCKCDVTYRYVSQSHSAPSLFPNLGTFSLSPSCRSSNGLPCTRNCQDLGLKAGNDPAHSIHYDMVHGIPRLSRIPSQGPDERHRSNRWRRERLRRGPIKCLHYRTARTQMRPKMTSCLPNHLHSIYPLSDVTRTLHCIIPLTLSGSSQEVIELFFLSASL